VQTMPKFYHLPKPRVELHSLPVVRLGVCITWASRYQRDDAAWTNAVGSS
jgi:hypothetical protein